MQLVSFKLFLKITRFDYLSNKLTNIYRKFLFKNDHTKKIEEKTEALIANMD
jgi:hypothetical protein